MDIGQNTSFFYFLGYFNSCVFDNIFLRASWLLCISYMYPYSSFVYRTVYVPVFTTYKNAHSVQFILVLRTGRILIMEKGRILIMEKSRLLIMEKGRILIIEKSRKLIIEKGRKLITEKCRILIMEKSQKLIIEKAGN